METKFVGLKRLLATTWVVQRRFVWMLTTICGCRGMRYFQRVVHLPKLVIEGIARTRHGITGGGKKAEIGKWKDNGIHQKSSFLCILFGAKKKSGILFPAASDSPSFSYHIKRFLLHQGASHLALGGTGLEEDNVTIIKDVVLALGHDLALSLDLGFGTELLEHGVVVYDTLDEGLLEVTVDNTSGLRSLGASTNGPLADLISTSGEE